MKLLNKFLKYSLPALVLFLLVFIPLYPKLPLLDIQNTWVYIRVEDFLVFFVLIFWFYLLIKKEVTLKTPLTIPILAFWSVGAIATIHGVVIIFPTISDVFPNVALLAFLRHIEYLSLFFLAFTAVKSKKFVYPTVIAITGTLLGVIAYGFGQKYLSLPAYLTMNEEYAKGIPIIISPLNRISSTFAGHYDLAAYLVLIIPILVSLIFGFKNIFIKIILGITSLLGIVLLFMTVSRVSFFVLFVALFAVLFFQKKKLFFAFVPVVFVLIAFFLFTQSSLLARFGNTVREVDVLVDTKTGAAIGQVKFYPRNYLSDKIILQDDSADGAPKATPSGILPPPSQDDIPFSLLQYKLPKQLAVVEAEITSTGETLPQGSSYINLALSPVTSRLNNFFYEYKADEKHMSSTVQIVPGDFLVKRASAYDLSFTTRFQGEWPNALAAFSRNLFFGSGYGSVSLAVDNNYLRMLGETGILGTLAFFAIFIVVGIYIKKALPTVESNVVKGLALGFGAGVIGLSLNAILIDVFEASKVAFQLWTLTGIVLGLLSLYQTRHFNIYKEFWSAITSFYAVIVYLLFLTFAIFSTSLSNYFIGDDFTWFRWAANCKAAVCGSIPTTIFQYFFNSEGFFYRPGTKVYFLLMYPLFWLNQVIYHMVSIGLHFVVVVLLYLVARRIFRNNLLAAAASFIFLIASGYLEIVVWIASTGHLFNAVFILLSLLLFIKWDDTKNKIYLALSLVSMLLSMAFHELGVVTPFLMVAYLFTNSSEYSIKSVLQVLKSKLNALLAFPVILYLFVRLTAHTHWLNGDYNYSLIKLPFNVVGNAIGYIMISLFGLISLPFYEKIREITRQNIPVAVILGIVFLVALYFGLRILIKSFDKEERRVAMFAVLFFFITLMPFIALGNITSRYSYLAAFGVIMIFVLIIGKLYRYLKSYGKDIAIASIVTILSVFSLVHVIQAQQTMIEWRGSGEKVQSFLTSLDSLYEDSWSRNKVSLHFSQVPLKNGEAWVFPVGLEDAVWFEFKNDNISVRTYGETSSVPRGAYFSKTDWVFEFQGDGSLKRMRNDKNEN